MRLARAFWCSAGVAAQVAERTARVIQRALAAAGIMNAGSLFLKWEQRKQLQLARAELLCQPMGPGTLAAQLALVLLFTHMVAAAGPQLETVPAGAN
jgi:hypothetical protein